MKKQTIYLTKYQWQITIFYNVKKQDVYNVIKELEDNHASDKVRRDVFNLLCGDRPNEGFTYTNARDRKSVVAIGFVDSIYEWIDTIEHEGRHVIQSICDYYGINPSSEEAAYIEGHLFKQAVEEFVYSVLRKLRM